MLGSHAAEQKPAKTHGSGFVIVLLSADVFLSIDDVCTGFFEIVLVVVSNPKHNARSA